MNWRFGGSLKKPTITDNRLHIIQGGIDNGDRDWLLRAQPHSRALWTVPKSVEIGDDAVIYVGPHGLMATAVISGRPKRHPRRKNRYEAEISSIRLIKPPISLASLRRVVP